MRLQSPRIVPIDPEQASSEQREVLGSVSALGPRPLNIIATLAKKPKAARAYLKWGTYALFQTNLDSRLRELAILRVGWNCRSGYEFAQHTRIGLEAGLTAGEIGNIKGSADADTWTPLERTILRAADEVCSDFFVSEPTWQRLAQEFSEEQCMDLVYVLGQYLQTCVFLNTFGVQVEDGTEVDPELCRWA